MSKSRTYQAIQIKRVLLDRVLSGREDRSVHVGLDVGKEHVFAVLRWGESDFDRPWKVSNPLEIADLVRVLVNVGRGRQTVVALEPTGTYGDPLRQSLSDAGLRVHRVSPKASHDYAEIFDGVPSKHDGKDAAVVAELAALGKSSAWPFEVRDWDQQLSYWVDQLDLKRRLLTMHYGRLESLLGRHWPEATVMLKLASGVLLRCLAYYGGPAAVRADKEVTERLYRWGRGKLSSEKIERWVAHACRSVGVRQRPIDVVYLQELAQAALGYRQELNRAKRELELLSADHEVIQSQRPATGLSTACVLWSHVGDPRDYDHGHAYRKAMGLNLKERSSGKWKGRLKISKRGKAQARRWLYFSAMRAVRNDPVKQWYEAKKSERAGDQAQPKKLLVSVMRKLSLVAHLVAVTEREYDPAMLFPSVVQAAKAA